MAESPLGNGADSPRLLWQPGPARVAGSQLAEFQRWLALHRGVHFADYAELWHWSTQYPAGFWGALAEFFAVHFHQPYSSVLSSLEMPGAQWFSGSTLNYAEHALRAGPGKSEHDPAVEFRREDGYAESLTYGQLRAAVAACRSALVDLGVQQGDRVVALLPNCPAALIAFLATASLGAIWSSCSPDFGAQAVQDRFIQLEPAVLITVESYRYHGRTFDIRAVIQRLYQGIPSLQATVLVDYLDDEVEFSASHPVLRWSKLLQQHKNSSLSYTAVPFNHPLWILYSSGTTGLPKGIVHGHGGILLEHLKVLALHSNLGPGDRFLWFTTTGWMMWNYLISGLLVGSTIVLFDGSPGYPDLGTLWRLVTELDVTYFGASAPFVAACRKHGLTPGRELDLSRLRAFGSTGAPLTEDSFDWLTENLAPTTQIASISGGTDLCTAFVGAAPTVPVWRGEISCRMLGAAVAAYNEQGQDVVDEVGELVITVPMPSMPVFFWNDPTGERLRAAYFQDYPGVWRHGDWIKITDRGSCVIYGRSDATLNRGGVRMGTSEFYRVVEALPEVLDALVIDTSGTSQQGELLCFLVLTDGSELAAVVSQLTQRLKSELSPRHVPDRFVVIAEVPRTLNGKKCEVPVKKILAGMPPEQAISADAMANPSSLQPFIDVAQGSKKLS